LFGTQHNKYATGKRSVRYGTVPVVSVNIARGVPFNAVYTRTTLPLSTWNGPFSPMAKTFEEVLMLAASFRFVTSSQHFTVLSSI
jgi:hypothetical protein